MLLGSIFFSPNQTLHPEKILSCIIVNPFGFVPPLLLQFEGFLSMIDLEAFDTRELSLNAREECILFSDCVETIMVPVSVEIAAKAFIPV